MLLSKALQSISVFCTVALVSAKISCKPGDELEGDTLCVDKYREGSYCKEEGFCSNPFASGCLRTLLPEEFGDNIRTCNSDDDADTIARGGCKKSALDFEEIRIHTANWESAMFNGWLMQILMSELLDVPVTFELSKPDGSLDFYDPELSFSYGAMGYDYDALETAVNYGDCRDVNNSNPEEGYTSCAHVFTEVWNGQKHAMKEYEKNGIIEPPSGIGSVGKLSWYVSSHTAERDPSLLSHYGMTPGNELETRRKMAETFLRPHKWVDFCENFSPDNCTSPYYDDKNRLIASRYPEGESESGSYFSAGNYHGHFAPTEDNNCTANPFNCTGHLTNFPCGWSTYAIQQAHYLGIPVKSEGSGVAGGYSYSALTQIWFAANYTESNILYYWFTPDVLLSDLIGTGAQFERVLLPPSTEECANSRVSPENRCSENPDDWIGSPLGACDSEAHSLQKLIVSNLYKRTYSVEEASRSPGYDAVKSFTVSDLQIEEMFRAWYKRDIDRWNYDPREAVCNWVAENIDALQRFVPRGYPRSIDSRAYNEPYLYAAIVFAALVALLVVSAGATTYRYRLKKVMVYAQVNFLYLLLLGLFFICMGSIVYAIEPSTGICNARQWFVVIGYSLELVPLIVKVAAINRLFRQANNMRRIKVKPSDLYISVGVLLAVVTLFLILWTAINPQTAIEQVDLTDTVNDSGGYVVKTGLACGSNTEFVFMVIIFLYQFFLLAAATVLAVQTRNVQQAFNESGRLSFVIYTHFLFLIFRVLVWLFRDLFPTVVGYCVTSFLLTGDALATLLIYFLPKILEARKPQSDYNSRRSSLTGASQISGLNLSENESKEWRRSSRGGAGLSSTVAQPRGVSFREASSIEFSHTETELRSSGDVNSAHFKIPESSTHAQTDSEKQNSSGIGSAVNTADDIVKPQNSTHTQTETEQQNSSGIGSAVNMADDIVKPENSP